MNILQQKMLLRHKGIAVRPSYIKENGDRIMSFTVPKMTMKKFKMLREDYDSGGHLVEVLLEKYSHSLKPPTDVISYSEFLSDMEPRTTVPHKEYKQTSVTMTADTFYKLMTTSSALGISRSAVIRLMVEAA